MDREHVCRAAEPIPVPYRRLGGVSGPAQRARQCHNAWTMANDAELPSDGSRSEDSKPTLHRVNDVYLWLEQGSSVHIKAVTSSGDPVELGPHHARELAAILSDLADQADQ